MLFAIAIAMSSGRRQLLLQLFPHAASFPPAPPCPLSTPATHAAAATPRLAGLAGCCRHPNSMNSMAVESGRTSIALPWDELSRAPQRLGSSTAVLLQNKSKIKQNMSRQAKLTLLGTSAFALGTVVFVHWQQKYEQEVRHICFPLIAIDSLC